MLENGEQVLWFSRPCRAPSLAPGDIFALFVTLPMIGVGVLGIIYGSQVRDAPPVLLPIVGIVFVVLAVWFSGVFRLVKRARDWRRSYYALTSSRIIKVIEAPDTPRYAFARTAISATRVDSNDDGSGSIYFTIQGASDWQGNVQTPLGVRGINPAVDPTGVGFFGIPEVHRVVALLR